MRVPLQRQQAMQRVADRVVWEVKRRQPCHDTVDKSMWVRVHLQRVLGWPYVKIERVYGVPVRTAKRWEKLKWGTGVLEDACKSGIIEREWVVENLSG